jgi:ABC-type bacteriocin/lantibiotic exporter with double-glycine peptidase domain
VPPTAIEVSDVVCGWEGGARVRVPSLQGEIGEMLAITGENGSGKTTLLRTLAGLYEPTSGEIALYAHGRRIEGSLRRFTTVLPQVVPLFDGTVIENLTLYDPEPDLGRLKSLLETFGLASAIDQLPNGLDGLISAGVIEAWSVGQLRKIGLVRAFYAPKRIVLLDEPSAALDAVAQQALKRMLDAVRDSHLIILVTHDPEYLAMCKRVYAMQRIGGSECTLLMADELACAAQGGVD